MYIYLVNTPGLGVMRKGPFYKLTFDVAPTSDALLTLPIWSDAGECPLMNMITTEGKK